jgi:hypothetical protein
LELVIIYVVKGVIEKKIAGPKKFLVRSRKRFRKIDWYFHCIPQEVFKMCRLIWHGQA